MNDKLINSVLYSNVHSDSTEIFLRNLDARFRIEVNDTIRHSTFCTIECNNQVVYVSTHGQDEKSNTIAYFVDDEDYDCLPVLTIVGEGEMKLNVQEGESYLISIEPDSIRVLCDERLVLSFEKVLNQYPRYSYDGKLIGMASFNVSESSSSHISIIAMAILLSLPFCDFHYNAQSVEVEDKRFYGGSILREFNDVFLRIVERFSFVDKCDVTCKISNGECINQVSGYTNENLRFLFSMYFSAGEMFINYKIDAPVSVDSIQRTTSVGRLTVNKDEHYICITRRYVEIPSFRELAFQLEEMINIVDSKYIQV